MPEESLNSNHARRLSITCRHIDKQLADMETALTVAMAEQQHISDLFVDRHKAFLASVLPGAKKEFEQVILSLPYGLGPRYRRRIMKEAQEIAKRYVLPWLRPEQDEAERQYRQVLPRFVGMG